MRIFTGVFLLLVLVCMPTALADELVPGTLTEVILGESPQTFTFTPSQEGVYELDFFADDAASFAAAELVGADNVAGTGTGSLFATLLNADTQYEITLSGSGTGCIEITRKRNGFAFTVPFVLESEYPRRFSSSEDVHWYSYTPETRGAMLALCLPKEECVSPSIELFTADGYRLAKGMALASRTAYVAHTVARRDRVLIRVHSESTGNYLLRAICGNDGTATLVENEMHMHGREEKELVCYEAGTLFYCESEDTSVAYADSYGDVTGVSAGETTATLIDAAGQVSVCTVTVERVVAEDLLVDAITERVGDKYTVEPWFTPSETTERTLSFYMRDTSVARVDVDTGELVGISEGETELVINDIAAEKVYAVPVTILPAVAQCRALLIGEQRYPDKSRERLGSTESVQAIQKSLEALTCDAGAWRITERYDLSRDEIVLALRDTFYEAKEKDISLVYIGCHGSYHGGITWLELSDGTMMSAQELERELRAISGQVIVLLDCCSSGGAIGRRNGTEDILDGVMSVFSDMQGESGFTDSKFVVICSAAQGQTSYRVHLEGEAWQTVFTMAFSEAIALDEKSGSLYADLDGDGIVTIAELERYLPAAVSRNLNELATARYSANMSAVSAVQTVCVSPGGSPLGAFIHTGE